MTTARYPTPGSSNGPGQGDITLHIDKEKKHPDLNLEVAPAMRVKLLYIDITYLSRTTQFLLLSTATFFFYLLYGYMQELIFHLEGFRSFGWYLTLIQFACYSVMALLDLQLLKEKTRKIPMRTYLLLAFLTVSTMGLSNTSVGYLNYPTQVIFKCCKLIPVLIGGIYIQGKRYSVIDVLAMCCMCVGLILFTLADSTVSPNYNTYGIILISLALCADGGIGNIQEKALKQNSASNVEMVLYSYSIGFLYLLVGMILSGTLLPAFTFCKEYPLETYGYAVIFSVCGYFGLGMVLSLVKTSGALVAVTVTTCRKAVTIILSFLFFTKPFTYQYVWSAMIVVLGIYLNIYSKNRHLWNRRLAEYLDSLYTQLGLRKTNPIAWTDETIV